MNLNRSITSAPSSSALNIHMPMGETWISRKQIQILNIINNDNKIKIGVCSNARNAIKIHYGKNKKENLFNIDESVMLSIVDSIIFDAYKKIIVRLWID